MAGAGQLPLWLLWMSLFWPKLPHNDVSVTTTRGPDRGRSKSPELRVRLPNVFSPVFPFFHSGGSYSEVFRSGWNMLNGSSEVKDAE